MSFDPQWVPSSADRVGGGLLPERRKYSQLATAVATSSLSPHSMSPIETPSAPVSRQAAVPRPAPAPTIPPMGFGDAIAVCFSKYISFSGRARRAEYWYWVLFTLLVQFGVGFALGMAGRASAASSASALISILLLLPGFAVLARRLHDTDHSAWWWLLCFTGIGAIVILVWLCQEGTRATNRFGPRTT